MRASSEAALERAQERWEPVLREVGSAPSPWASSCFGVVDVLDGSGALRRALTEPSRDGEDKAALAGAVLGGKVDPEVVDLVAGPCASAGPTTAICRRRWSPSRSSPCSPRPRSRAGSPTSRTRPYRLVRMLAGRARAAQRRRGPQPPGRAPAALMEAVLEGKVVPPRPRCSPCGPPESLRRRSVTTPCGDVTELAARAAAAPGGVGDVRGPALAGADRPARGDPAPHLRPGRPGARRPRPSLLGGVRVQVGDDVIDGTLATRLADARRRLAG